MNFDFYGNRKKFFVLSLMMVAVAIISAFTMGIHLDIKFKGGAILTYSFEGELDRNAFQSTSEEVLGQRGSVQEQTDVITGKQNYVLSLPSVQGLTSEKQLELSSTLESTYPDNKLEAVTLSVVDPVIGKEFLAKCLVAVAFASLLMIIYVGFRFKRISGWSAGVVAVIALLHDLTAVFATFAICRFSVNDNFIAVALTILGYSLNDTIVIYDRIRENEKLYGKQLTLPEIVNKSINQSFSRSITTTVTTVAAMAVVAGVCVYFNLTSMLSFAIPLIVGMVSGFYSSVFVAAPLWCMWQQHKGGTKPQEA